MENATMTDPAKILGDLMVLILLIAIIYLPTRLKRKRDKEG